MLNDKFFSPKKHFRGAIELFKENPLAFVSPTVRLIVLKKQKNKKIYPF